MSAPPDANALLSGGPNAPRRTPAEADAAYKLLKIMWERLGWAPPLPHITDIERNPGGRSETQRRRPRVVPPGRNEALLYYSPTKTAQMPDGEKWALQRWNERQVAKGVALDHGIQDRIIASQDDNDALDELVAQAKTRAKSDQGANQGTARHKITEKLDFGIDPGPLSDRLRADIEAYRAVTRGLDMVLAEVFVVHDLSKMGGTLDRVAYYPVTGRYHIVDLKPPDSGYGQGERAIQFGIYSRSQAYNWNLAQHLLATDRKALKTTNLRAELPAPLDLERAIMVHVPRGGVGRAFTAWVDIDQGWNEGFDIAKRMRRWQSRDFQESLVTPFEVKPPPTVIDAKPSNGALPRSAAAALAAAPSAAQEAPLFDPVIEAIEAAADLDALKAVYAANKGPGWTEAYTVAYKSRRDQVA